MKNCFRILAYALLITGIVANVLRILQEVKCYKVLDEIPDIDEEEISNIEE